MIDLIPPDLVPIYLFGVIVVGALVVEVFALKKDFDGARAFLRKVRPTWPPDRIERWNVIIILTLGPLVAAIMTGPQTEPQAFTAGLGWVGFINIAAGAKTNGSGGSAPKQAEG